MIENNKIFNLEGVKLGPTYFENISQKFESKKGFENIEWRAKLKYKCTNINFYGFNKFFEDYQESLIVKTDFSEQIVTAVNIFGQEILLFDGCKHGYNSMLCDKFTSEQISNRPINQTLFLENKDEFEIFLSSYYQIDFDEEFSDEVNENGMIDIIDGSFIAFSELKRNAFDVFEILVSDRNGKIYPILQEELA